MFIRPPSVPALIAIASGFSLPTQAQTLPDYGFDFATIGALNNAPFHSDPLQFGDRGSVSYLYRISKTEITTGQWLEFMNTFGGRQNGPPVFGDPITWGAALDGTYHGPGYHWVLNTNLPRPEQVPVLGISWRAAAEYCNWLCNDKRADWSAFQNGAYDISTFTSNPNGTVNDQAAHNPGARFWIPTLDEWLKAVHYDPNRYGQGQGGWWGGPAGSDDLLTPGPPGQGQTGAGLPDPGPGSLDAACYFPVGSYPQVRSPWGLLDTSGGAAEWLEDFNDPGQHMFRLLDGTWAGCQLNVMDLDRPQIVTDGYPTVGIVTGIRIASAVPTPATPVIVACGLAIVGPRRRRR